MKNLSGLMKQAQQMQSKMQEMQAKLEGMEIDGVAGAGLVTITLNGKGDLKRIKIDPKVADPADVEMLEDLIAAAHRNAKAEDRGGRGGRDAEGHRRPATAAGHEAAVLTVAPRWPRGPATHVALGDSRNRWPTDDWIVVPPWADPKSRS